MFVRRQLGDFPGSSTNRPFGSDPTTGGPSTTTSSSATSAATSGNTKQDPGSNSNSTDIIVGAVCVGVIVAIAVVFVIVWQLRRKHRNPKYIPTSFLKNLWVKWTTPKSARKHTRDTSDHLEPISTAGSNMRHGNYDAADLPASSAPAAVDRHTSVRSVMTLPAYHPAPRPSEQVLGREGERGGIDIVLEYPETAEEAEARRDEEMEALYQVRQARRNEIADREERRRLRHEARERGDWVALEELRQRDRANSAALAVEAARAERERVRQGNGERARAISSVSYADLGVARHDGTRIRANSNDSERQGLLGDAASIGASSSWQHGRQRSTSSVLSIDTTSDLDHPSPSFARPRANSRPESPLRTVSMGPGSMSSPELVDAEGDVGDEEIPINSPPGYENIELDDASPHEHYGSPPDYTSPVESARHSLLGDSRRESYHNDSHAPSIAEVSQPVSPASSVRQSRHSVQSVSSATSIAQKRESAISMTGSTTGSIPRRTLASEERRSSARSSMRSNRGVGGVPQLPSLRLGTLPSIVLDTGTPVSRTTNEEDEGRAEERHEQR